MRDALANPVPLEIQASADREITATKLAGIRTSTFAQAFAVAAVLALWVAPSTPAQSTQATQPAQSQNASTPAQPAASNDPQMVDQSAPAADSLGEAARKAKAAKAKSADGSTSSSAAATAAGPKVYSNENLGSLSSHGVSYVGSGNNADSAGTISTNSGSTQSSGSGNAASKSDESYWRGQAQQIRSQMADIDRQISRIQDDIAKNGAVSIDPQSGARQGVIMVEDRNADIKRLEDRKADLQNSLDQLAEEGRKAGADSGWFR
jgi:hypothetical protein